MKKKQIAENKYRMIEAKYMKGGFNYFTYKTDPRGYRISLETIERDGTTTIITPMNDRENLNVFVKEAKRFNKNTLAKIDSWVDQHADKIFAAWEKMVLMQLLNIYWIISRFKEVSL